MIIKKITRALLNFSMFGYTIVCICSWILLTLIFAMFQAANHDAYTCFLQWLTNHNVDLGTGIDPTFFVWLGLIVLEIIIVFIIWLLKRK